MPPSNSSVSSLVAEVSERLSSAVGDRGYPGVVAALLVVLLLLYFPFRLLKAGGEEKKTGAKEQATSEEETYPEPMPQGDMTVAELKQYDGSDPTVPVLVAAKGKVYDMTKGRDYYGGEGATPAPSRCVRNCTSIPLYPTMFLRCDRHPRGRPRELLRGTCLEYTGEYVTPAMSTRASRPYAAAKEPPTTVSPASTAAALWPR
jgi:hypothetical protein